METRSRARQLRRAARALIEPSWDGNWLSCARRVAHGRFNRTILGWKPRTSEVPRRPRTALIEPSWDGNDDRGLSSVAATVEL